MRSTTKPGLLACSAAGPALFHTSGREALQLKTGGELLLLRVIERRIGGLTSEICLRWHINAAVENNGGGVAGDRRHRLRPQPQASACLQYWTHFATSATAL